MDAFNHFLETSYSSLGTEEKARLKYQESSRPGEAQGKLRKIREDLTALSKDRSTYINSADVIRYYKELSDLVNKFWFFAKDTDEEDTTSTSKTYLQIHDCFVLISLFYLTVGRNHEPPAAFAILLIIERLIAHLNESGNFSAKDVQPIEAALTELQENITQGKNQHPSIIINGLEFRIHECYDKMKPLKQKLSQISPELAPLHERLVSIRRSIRRCESKTQFPTREVEDFKRQLEEIEATKAEGKFLAKDGSEPMGSDLVLELHGQAKRLADQALAGRGGIAPGLRNIADKLFKLKYNLEKLSVTQAWSLRETDLFDYIVQVRDLDYHRVKGRFVDREGNVPDEGQDILLYLMRKCYMHIFELLIMSEPVSEGLTPVYNQLQTVQRCLLEVQKSGGVSSTRELYPYSMKLNSLDNLRVDGKFMVGSDIPEGQGRVNALLAECYEVLHELRIATEDLAKSNESRTPVEE